MFAATDGDAFPLRAGSIAGPAAEGADGQARGVARADIRGDEMLDADMPAAAGGPSGGRGSERPAAVAVVPPLAAPEGALLPCGNARERVSVGAGGAAGSGASAPGVGRIDGHPASSRLPASASARRRGAAGLRRIGSRRGGGCGIIRTSVGSGH